MHFQPHGSPVENGAQLKGAEQSATVSFTTSFCFPLIIEGLKICSTVASYLLITFSSKNTGAKQQQILFDLCVFLKSVLCAYWELCF